MAKIDLSAYTEDELTHLIDEATNIRTTKFEGMDSTRNTTLKDDAVEQLEQEQAFAASGGD